jgi:hypothetical protein
MEKCLLCNYKVESKVKLAKHILILEILNDEIK